MENTLLKSTQRNPWTRYGVAVVAPFLALLLRMPLAPFLGNKGLYTFSFIATAASAMYGGFNAGAVTTLISAFLIATFVIPSQKFLVLDDPNDYLTLAMFLGSSATVSYLAGRMVDARKHERAIRLILQQTLLSIGDAVVSTDLNKRVRLMNRAAEQLTGWTQAEAKGKRISDVVHIVAEGTQAPVENPIDLVLATGRIGGLPQHTELISRDGRRIPLDDSGAPVCDENGMMAGAVLVFRDISDRRAAEKRLEAAEIRSRTILESISDSFLQLDRDWRFSYVNPAAEKTLSRTSQQLLGRNCWTEYPDLVGTAIDINCKKAMAGNQPIWFETLDEKRKRWFDIAAYPSQDGLSIYFREITDRKRTEQSLKHLNEDLTQFTYAATHDLREPLRTMSLNAELLQRALDTQLDERKRAYLTNLITGAHRMARLIDGLLQYSGVNDVPEVHARPVDTGNALREVLESLQVTINENNAVVTVHGELPPVAANHVHVTQLFQNLIANALKYSRPGVPPEIRISAQQQDSYLVVAVADNGIGVAAEHQDRIFAPFKRLHGPEISGAGIGLATCKRIVERYQGRLWIESEPGKGSTFYFSLPTATRSSAATASR